ncbi:murein biosynthesis integral membrane protein MurJ [Chamaesiphon minutus]|uniref:Probable lipid II flippase MurJ n=1 Tax=Chamaesiphon minutus (strain ATCC 27169 / PCC 6605) TaxID=1173020 RepID=K9UL60_CHAP6|nr:murein biosynthesis integral membrane protein MurJ [Chamaesiphon minutus]AFY95570.1 integral membrane protein MviN [Chamaesiphon minutus PCC 6605]
MTESKKPTRSIASIAGIVAAATLISKVFGLVRSIALAAAFGNGIVTEAFAYAYAIPGFLLILLGGINGPFHSAIVSVLTKEKDKSQVAPIVETITTIVGIVLLCVSIAIFCFASNAIDIVAPNLAHSSDAARGALVRQCAIEQLQIMSAMAVLAGFIGIGFGTLSSADFYWLPSISPLLTSSTTIVGVGVLAVYLGPKIMLSENALLAGKVLAGTTLIGALLQWLMQVITQWRVGLGTIKPRLEWRRQGVQDVLKILGPATFSSGTLQINLFIDLAFASGIAGAASAMQYSGLLIQTPLGIISNIILVSLLPEFSRLADPQNWTQLKDRIRQGLLLTGIAMMPLSAVMMALAFPIVQTVYQYGAFKTQDSQLVGSILIASSLGMFIFLGRDVLVRVFYALGDGSTPFKISMVNIFFNFLFDYLFWKPFGAAGITLSTVCINLISFSVMLFLLDRRLNGLPWRGFVPLLGIFFASTVAGGVTWGISYGWQQFIPVSNTITLLVQLAISGGMGFAVFAAIVSQLKLPEFDRFVAQIRQKIFKK